MHFQNRELRFKEFPVYVNCVLYFLLRGKYEYEIDCIMVHGVWTLFCSFDPPDILHLRTITGQSSLLTHVHKHNK